MITVDSVPLNVFIQCESCEYLVSSNGKLHKLENGDFGVFDMYTLAKY